MHFYLLLSFGALFISIIFLWWAGDLSVDYSIRFADIFNLNTLFIGFVLISVSTGLPELLVAISSTLRGVVGIAAGGILGSNVSDISLVLGLAIILYGALIISEKEAKDSLHMLFISAIAMVIVFFMGSLNWIFGLFLILLYFAFIYWLWLNSTKKEIIEEVDVQKKTISNGIDLHVNNKRPSVKEKIFITLKLLASIILVLVASELTVHFAIDITNKLFLSLKTIGATIIAIGTSLPELSVSLNAMKKKQYSMALGNSLGSVLEQGTLLIGILALISDKPVDTASLRSLVPFMFFPFFIIGFSIIKRKKIGKIESILMLICFFIFLIYQIGWIK